MSAKVERGASNLFLVLFFVNLLIPFLFLSTPVGLGLEGDTLDYRLPLIDWVIRHGSYPNFAWTYVDDYPALPEFILLFLRKYANEYIRIFPVLSYAFFSAITYKLMRLYLNKSFALVATLQTITVSAVVAQDNALMTDLFASSVFLMGMYYCLKSAQFSVKKSDFYLGGLFLGLSLACRYSQIPAVVASVVALFGYLALKKKPMRWHHYSIFLCLLFLPMLPFLIRNVLLNQNPVFPLLNALFKSNALNAIRTVEINSMFAGFGYAASLANFLLLPIRFALDKSAFDYSFGPWFLFYLPLQLYGAFCCAKKLIHRNFNFLLFLFFVYLVAWFIGSRQARFFYHGLPFLMLTGMMALSHWLRKQSPRTGAFWQLLLFLLCLISTEKHFKKHHEEVTGEAFLVQDGEVNLRLNTLPEGKVLFIERTGNVAFLHRDFVFAYPHIYATSALDYRNYSDQAAYRAALFSEGVRYVFVQNPQLAPHLAFAKKIFQSSKGARIYEL